MDEVEEGLENEQNLDINSAANEDIPPKERTILDQIREIIAEGYETTMLIHLRKLTRKD